MKVNRVELINVLEKVAPALGFNALVPEFQCFQIYGNKVQVTDGAMLAEATLPIDLGFTCAVIGGPFLNLLKGLEEEYIELLYEDDNIVVKTNKVKGTFAVSSAVGIKEIPQHKSHIISSGSLPDLIEGFAFCKDSVSKDATSGPCQGVGIRRTHLFSTNRFRIASWELVRGLSFECSVPLKFVDVVEKNQENTLQLYYAEPEKTLVMILQDGTSFSSSVFSGEYPDLEQYFPTKDSFEQIEFSGEVVSTIDRHISFLSRIDMIDKEVDIKILGSKCSLESKDAELGSLVEEVDVVNKNNCEVQFRVNPMFLKGVVDKFLAIKYYKEKGLILFGGDKMRYLIQDREE